MKYTVEQCHADIGAAEYIARFRDVPRFLALCRRCPAYGKSWGCPPFGKDADAWLSRYTKVRIFAITVTPAEKDIPVDRAQELILPERMRIERELLEMERRYDGRAMSYIGKCLYCPDGKCSRKEGKPCLHPEKVRPSLEAYGFDVGRTLKELFGIDLQWSSDGMLPPQLTIVTALFHNGSF